MVCLDELNVPCILPIVTMAFLYTNQPNKLPHYMRLPLVIYVYLTVKPVRDDDSRWPLLTSSSCSKRNSKMWSL